jgi:threonyl-tRNA synthetase
MKQINVTLSDGSVVTFPQGITPVHVAQNISKKLEKTAIAARLNGDLVDINIPINEDCQLEIITENSPEGHKVLLHSTAHLMAHAVKELFPEARVTIGPALENRFYYDFDVESPFSPEDLERIEQKMKELAQKDYVIERYEWTREKAIEFFKSTGEIYKVEIIQELDPDETISVYQQDGFIDLCLGPHVPSTGRIKAFKLLNTAGAYWRGDEKNKMLQRIYGTAFPSAKELKLFLKKMEEAKKRDHRKLGKELELFTFTSLAPASPIFLPKGTIIYNLLIDYIKSLYHKYNFQEVITPQILEVSLWKKSGHYNNFKENMYFIHIDDRDFAIKPMNCPTHMFVYSFRKRSYRDLPLRIADFGRLHRNELAGVTGGLTRVRSFSQDDAHIFCTPGQIESEIILNLEMLQEIYSTFGFNDVTIYLSTRPEKSLGTLEMWNQAENSYNPH